MKYKKEVSGMVCLFVGIAICISSAYIFPNILFIPGFILIALGLGLIGAMDIFGSGL